MPREFDLIIADQVFEHLKWPLRAGRNVYSMLKPGGHFIIATPFFSGAGTQRPNRLLKMTANGLSYLLQECGFEPSEIRADSWGNRGC